MSDRDPVVAIIGSRDWPDLQRVRTFVTHLAAKYPDAIVISGGAYGTDRAAEEAADEAALGVISLRPVEHTETKYTCELVANERARYILGQVALDYITVLLEGEWTTYAKACFFRNTIIVQCADQVVAFWKPQSRGTLHAINHAHQLKRPVHIYRPEE